MWLAEAAVQEEDLDLLHALSRYVSGLVQGTHVDLRVRLRLAFADIDETGETWRQLMREPQTRLPAGLIAQIHTRHGRWHAWRGQPDIAEESFRRAVQLTIGAGLQG